MVTFAPISSSGGIIPDDKSSSDEFPDDPYHRRVPPQQALDVFLEVPFRDFTDNNPIHETRRARARSLTTILSDGDNLTDTEGGHSESENIHVFCTHIVENKCMQIVKIGNANQAAFCWV